MWDVNEIIKKMHRYVIKKCFGTSDCISGFETISALKIWVWTLDRLAMVLEVSIEKKLWRWKYRGCCKPNLDTE